MSKRCTVTSQPLYQKSSEEERNRKTDEEDSQRKKIKMIFFDGRESGETMAVQ